MISRSDESPAGLRTTLLQRLPAFAAILVLLSSLAIAFHYQHDLPDAWRSLGIPSLRPDFADTRTVTDSIDCLLSGKDPYTVRSCDPWYRLYNYPPLWLQLRYLGVRSTTTEGIAAFFGATFFLSCLALFRAKRWITAVIVFLALLSYPVLFAVERGNSDLLIFAMLTTGALWLGRNARPPSTFKQATLITVLTILKIYPVVFVTAMLRNRKMVSRAVAASLVALAALAATSGSKLIPTLRNTPRANYLSFGSFPMSREMGLSHRWPVGVFLAIIGVLLGVMRRDPVTRGLPKIDLDSSRGFIAAAGLTLYIFVFLCGSSFDYRLIFLLCPLMYLVEDLNQQVRRIPLLCTIVLVAFLFCARVSGSGPKEWLDAVVFVWASAWLIDTLCTSLALRPTTLLFRRSERRTTVSHLA